MKFPRRMVLTALILALAAFCPARRRLRAGVLPGSGRPDPARASERDGRRRGGGRQPEGFRAGGANRFLEARPEPERGGILRMHHQTQGGRLFFRLHLRHHRDSRRQGALQR